MCTRRAQRASLWLPRNAIVFNINKISSRFFLGAKQSQLGGTSFNSSYQVAILMRHTAHLLLRTWEGSRVCGEPRPINLFFLAFCWAASVHVHEVGLAFCAASMQQWSVNPLLNLSLDGLISIRLASCLFLRENYLWGQKKYSFLSWLCF